MPHLDFTQPPFDVLSAAERQSIKKNTQVRYLAILLCGTQRTNRAAA